jgi:hypothetical protein
MNTIPIGFRKIPASIYVNDKTGKIIVTASPWDVWPAKHDSDESPHDCDMAGCGWEHVVARGELLENRISHSSIHCEHANEMPAQCPCPEKCYCRVHGNCGNRDL